MRKDTDTLCAVAFVLDYVRGGPARIEDLYGAADAQFGFTRWDVAEAGRHLGLLGKKLDGVSYVYRPHNLVAIWWAKRSHVDRWCCEVSGGNAA
jgi:hypothetical protein